jgi:alpha-1,2-mannosyltransferase
LSAAVLVVACRGMRHAFAASQNAWALSLNAFAVLLISPVSWSHHWVWSVPAVLTLAALGLAHHRRLPLVTAACGLLVFAASLQWWLPRGAGRELRWAIWQQIAGSSYVLFAALVLLLSASAKLTPARTPTAPPAPLHAGRPLASAAPPDKRDTRLAESHPTSAAGRGTCAADGLPDF